MTGMIADPSGADIPRAEITLRAPGDDKILAAAVTDENGVFRLSGVEPRVYDIQVAASGFESYRLNAVTIKPGENKLGTTRLKIGRTFSPIVEGPSPTP